MSIWVRRGVVPARDTPKAYRGLPEDLLEWDSWPLAAPEGRCGAPEDLTNRQLDVVEMAVRQGFEPWVGV